MARATVRILGREEKAQTKHEIRNRASKLTLSSIDLALSLDEIYRGVDLS